MHGLDPARWQAGPEPVVQGDGDGARMLAATLAWEVACAGTDRDRSVELARFALAEDRLFEVDSGLFWVVAANARMVADDDLGDFWERARAQAHARGSLFTALSVNLWQGLWQWRARRAADAVACFEAMLEQERMWGGSGTGRSYALAFLVGAHLDRGDLDAARARRRAGARRQPGRRGRPAGPARGRPAAARRGRLGRGAGARRRRRRLGPRWSQPGLEPAARPAGRGPGRSRAPAGGGRAAAGGGGAAAPAGGAELPRDRAAPAGRDRRGAGLEHLREAVAVLSPTTAELEKARAE